MSGAWFQTPLMVTLLPIALLLGALALLYRPLGDYLARVYTGSRDLAVEKGAYRLIGVDLDQESREQTPRAYLRSVLAFSLVSMLGLYLLQRT